MTPRLTLTALSLVSVLLLAGCELEALLADPRVAQRAADSKAIGSACRHGLRSIEDCYSLNEKASKAGIFDGWKEMDQYMRENKIEGIEPKGIKPPPKEDAMIEEKASEDTTAAKSKPKPKADKPAN